MYAIRSYPQLRSREQAAVAISFVTLFFAAGQLIGPFAAGILLENTGNFRLMFMISSTLLGLGIFMSWRSGKQQ